MKNKTISSIYSVSQKKREKPKPELPKYPFPMMKNKEAREAGYIAITTPYCMEDGHQEVQWFHNVLRDMRGCDCVIVEFRSGLEVWRHSSQVDLDHNGIRRAAPGSASHKFYGALRKK